MPPGWRLVSIIVVVGCASCRGSSVTADGAARESGPETGNDAHPDVAIERSASCNSVAAIRAVGDVWALKLDGSVWRWGGNATGQLGDGTMTNAPAPIELATLGANVLEIAPGAQDTFARTADGNVYSWGNNSDGQLGAGGTPLTTLTPLRASLLGSDVAQLSPGQYHSCARKTDARVWCWGQNVLGEVGDGTTTQRTSPTEVTALGPGVAEVSAGGYFTCARKTDGTLWCWGTNANGRLGDGSSADQSRPVQVTALGSRVAAIATSFDYACALDKDGGVWCWGWNVDGNLGDGTRIDRATPVNVAGLAAGVSKVSVSADHACALQLDGSLWCWGNNLYGQLGDGTTADRLTPGEVSALGQAVADVAAGANFTCALRTDSSVWCWGSGAYGMLGDQTSGQRSIPGPVLGCP